MPSLDVFHAAISIRILLWRTNPTTMVHLKRITFQQRINNIKFITDYEIDQGFAFKAGI